MKFLGAVLYFIYAYVFLYIRSFLWIVIFLIIGFFIEAIVDKVANVHLLDEWVKFYTAEGFSSLRNNLILFLSFFDLALILLLAIGSRLPIKPTFFKIVGFVRAFESSATFVLAIFAFLLCLFIVMGLTTSMAGPAIFTGIVLVILGGAFFSAFNFLVSRIEKKGIRKISLLAVGRDILFPNLVNTL